LQAIRTAIDWQTIANTIDIRADVDVKVILTMAWSKHKWKMFANRRIACKQAPTNIFRFTCMSSIRTEAHLVVYFNGLTTYVKKWESLNVDIEASSSWLNMRVSTVLILDFML